LEEDINNIFVLDLEYELKVIYETIYRASGITDLITINNKVYIFFDPYNKYITECRKYQYNITKFRVIFIPALIQPFITLAKSKSVEGLLEFLFSYKNIKLFAEDFFKKSILGNFLNLKIRNIRGNI
jgi:hypothetical protein